jgi:hypothetical protein
MKKFNSFLDAFNPDKKCPLCLSFMKINERDIAEDFIFDDNRHVTFYLDRNEDSTFTIDMLNHNVSLNIREAFPEHYLYDINSSSYIPKYQSSHYLVKNGLMLQALTIDCISCCQYSYTLQLHLNLSTKKLTSIYLNSETISFEDKGVVHEIKNIYSLKETQYSCFPKDGSARTTQLPLIELNLDKPKETINRIKKLLIFT